MLPLAPEDPVEGEILDARLRLEPCGGAHNENSGLVYGMNFGSVVDFGPRIALDFADLDKHPGSRMIGQAMNLR